MVPDFDVLEASADDGNALIRLNDPPFPGVVFSFETMSFDEAKLEINFSYQVKYTCGIDVELTLKDKFEETLFEILKNILLNEEFRIGKDHTDESDEGAGVR